MTPSAPVPTPRDIVAQYFAMGFRLVFWPQIGDTKGPKEPEWQKQTHTLADYHEGNRVGVLTGVEVAPGRFMHDVDIDWAPGSLIAQKLLPPTDFIFGRASKRVSHCFYTLPEALPSFRYEDIDKSCLIELRGTKLDGTIGFQTMVPPSIWTKDGQRELLIFVKDGEPGFCAMVAAVQRAVLLSAIGLILAKHLGANGFGHETRLAWAGFLLRAGISKDDLIVMGEAMSVCTNNLEVHDVRVIVESTAERMTKPNQKIKGGPALAKILGPNGKKVVALINEWLGRDSDFIRNKDGGIVRDSQENIRRAVQVFDVTLSNNWFAEQMLIQEPGGPTRYLDDEALEELWLRVDRDLHFRPTYSFFEKVLKSIAREHTFHPVRDYLDTLVWDKTPRIDTWLIRYAKAEDSKYLRAVSAIVLMAAVKRIREPGCKYDEMLVLESEQGLLKSSALRALCPNEDWFSDDLPLNVDSKQVIERTLGKWIIESSDLAGMRVAQREHLKSMLSRQVDGPARMAYAHRPVSRPRHFILVGTTNDATYLPDSTGARRFWPVSVKEFDVKAILRDRDQLWAEAAERVAAGESIRLHPKLYAAAKVEQEKRREPDAWEEQITNYLFDDKLVQPDEAGCRRVATGRIWDALAIETNRRDMVGSKRISAIMQRLGFARGKVLGEEGKYVVGYIGPPEALAFEGGKE